MTKAPELAALKAIAHPIRLGMMQQLATQAEICACDFGDDFDVSQPTISEHLRVLRTAGLVTTRRQGNQICYSAVPEAVVALGELVAGLRPVADLRRPG